MSTSAPIPLKAGAEGVTLQVKVHPRARRNAVHGVVGDALKIAVTAPADQGKANQAVREFLAEAFHIPAASIKILSGLTSPRKVLRLEGISAEQAGARLKQLLEPASA